MSASKVTPLVPGALIYNRLFAWKESFGVVEDDHDGLCVSNEFPQFIADRKRILPKFLYLFCTIPSTTALVNAASAGSAAVSRNRFKESEFESFKLRLPPLATQRDIVASWEDAQEKCSGLLKEADAQETVLQREFLVALGLDQKPGIVTGKSFALRWSEVERWGVNQAKRLNDAPDPSAGHYPVIRLGEIVADLQNGWSPKCFARPVTGDEWGVLKPGSVSYGTYNPKANKALPPSFTPSTAYEVKAGDVLFVRGNVLELVGIAAFVEETPPRLMMPDLIFRAVFRKDSEIDPRYLAEIMKTPHVRHQIEAVATGTSPSMKKISKPGLLALQIPLPPLAIQKQLVKTIATARAGIAEKRAAAAELKARTARENEEMILGHRAIDS